MDRGYKTIEEALNGENDRSLLPAIRFRIHTVLRDRHCCLYWKLVDVELVILWSRETILERKRSAMVC